MEERLTKIEKGIEDLTDIVVSIKDYMEKSLVTKEELSGELDSFEKRLELKMNIRFEEIGGKIDGLGRRIDGEVEKQAHIETRVRKVEEMVSPT